MYSYLTDENIVGKKQKRTEKCGIKWGVKITNSA